jgi:hypothetical protein
VRIGLDIAALLLTLVGTLLFFVKDFSEHFTPVDKQSFWGSDEERIKKRNKHVIGTICLVLAIIIQFYQLRIK